MDVPVFCPFQIAFVIICVFHIPILGRIHVLWTVSLRLWLAVVGRPPRWTQVILASWCLRSGTVFSSLEQTHGRFSKRNCKSNGTCMTPGTRSWKSFAAFILSSWIACSKECLWEDLCRELRPVETSQQQLASQMWHLRNQPFSLCPGFRWLHVTLEGTTGRPGNSHVPNPQKL